MAEIHRDFDITREELDNIGKALKNEEFRKLLVDYCEEMTDPATRKQYEEEITELEKERGVEVKFINPVHGYVIKTSVEGNKIAFINVCSNENVQKPISVPAMQDGSRGINWSVPHLLSPPREDLNKKGKRCNVYDVIFHPEALLQASKNINYRDFINNIATQAVVSNYGVILDKANLKFPKMQYKGMSRPIVIRKKTGSGSNLDLEDPLDQSYADIYKKLDEKTPVVKNEVIPETSKYATPKYLIKHRTNLDIQDFTYHTSSHLNDAFPKELIVEIDLPLLKSSADLELDVTEKSVSLISEKPAKYKLDLTLPYAVNEDSGSARFEQDVRKLTITLPVKRCNLLLSDIGRDDSGVDSDNSPFTDSSSVADNSLPLIEELKIDSESSEDSLIDEKSAVFRTSSSFLDSEIHYSLPEYSCNLYNDTLVFTLHVKNVDPTSLDKLYNDNNTSLHIKFSSISPAFVPVFYAFYLYLPSHSIDTENVSVEVWDNNVIAQITYKPNDSSITSYWAGTSEDCTEEKLVEEPSNIFNKRFNKKVINVSDDENDNEVPKVQVEVKSSEDVSVIINPVKEDDESSDNSNFIPRDSNLPMKSRSYSESSGDEFGASPTKGILKMGRSRTPVSRSVSESSIDDYTWSSFENCASVSDCHIPEESEVSSSMKKTVRFNDVVSQQLFR